MICGDPVRDPASLTHVTNPSVVVEVLSSSTEEYDRVEKWEHYQRIATLHEYVLVSQDRREIAVYARMTSDSWRRSTYGHADTVELSSIGVRFTVDELYDAAGIR